MIDEPKNNLLSLLEEGGWVFEKIKPLFLNILRSKLLQQKQLSESRVCELKPFGLTALFYGLVEKRELEQESVHFCNTLTGARLIPFPNIFPFKRFASLVQQGVLHFIPSEYEIEILQAAENLMGNKAFTCWKEYNSHIDRLYYVKNMEGKAASHPHLFGIIFVGEQRLHDSLEKIAISFVHELAHQELFLLNTIDRLVLSSADHHLIHAPFQGKVRPPIGRLHACHALYRTLQCEQEMGIEDKEHQKLFRETLASLSPDELTPFGGALVQRIYQSYSQRF